jgi:hypothetical protein
MITGPSPKIYEVRDILSSNTPSVRLASRLSREIKKNLL